MLTEQYTASLHFSSSFLILPVCQCLFQLADSGSVSDCTVSWSHSIRGWAASCNILFSGTLWIIFRAGDKVRHLKLINKNYPVSCLSCLTCEMRKGLINLLAVPLPVLSVADLPDAGRRFAAALLPRLFGTNPRSHHKGATCRVRTGNQRLLVLCHCQLGQDIAYNCFAMIPKINSWQSHVNW